MAVISCRSCGAVVDDAWSECPECGADPRIEPPTSCEESDAAVASEAAKARQKAEEDAREPARRVRANRTASEATPVCPACGQGAMTNRDMVLVCPYCGYEKRPKGAWLDAVADLGGCLTPGCLVPVLTGTAVTFVVARRLRDSLTGGTSSRSVLVSLVNPRNDGDHTRALTTRIGCEGAVASPPACAQQWRSVDGPASRAPDRGDHKEEEHGAGR
jgi:ribosomal protein L32